MFTKNPCKLSKCIPIVCIPFSQNLDQKQLLFPQFRNNFPLEYKFRHYWTKSQTGSGTSFADAQDKCGFRQEEASTFTYHVKWGKKIYLSLHVYLGYIEISALHCFLLCFQMKYRTVFESQTQQNIVQPFKSDKVVGPLANGSKCASKENISF